MRETDKFYFFWNHEFGQKTQRDIICRPGITFNCCEQYMMYQKAQLFGDAKTASEILIETNPAKQQDLGRLVQNYDQKVWEMNRLSIVIAGNMLKFTQHEDLRERLLATDNKILCEASPYDKVWGCGLADTEDKILNINAWPGLNLLGQCLMTVRTLIQNQKGL